MSPGIIMARAMIPWNDIEGTMETITRDQKKASMPLELNSLRIAHIEYESGAGCQSADVHVRQDIDKVSLSSCRIAQSTGM